MRLLYIVTKGMDDPTLASVPLHIAANGSVDIGQEVSVVLAGDATELVIEDNLQRLEGVGVPPPENCWASSRNTRFLSTSERRARWPVGPPRRRRAWPRSTAGGRRPRTWRGSPRKPTGCSPSSVQSRGEVPFHTLR